MRKKIFGIFTFVIMMLSCICFSACSDKYEDFEFVIMYAYSADATEWTNVDDETIFNYGSDEDLLKLQNDRANIFFKVDIANVKEKHIDDIIVSKNGSTVIVKENQVFSISIPAVEMTEIKLYETNSGKSTKLSLGVYPALTDLKIKQDSLIPAMFEKGDLRLTSLMNIEYWPNETKQTGVRYSVLSDNGEIVDETTLRAKDNADGAKNIIKVRATSVHNEEISVEFDVVVLPSPNKTSVTFKTSDGSIGENASSFTLYAGGNYATTKLEVSKPYDIQIGGHTYAYKLHVAIDGVPYDESKQGENGLLVSVEDNIVTITAMDSRYSLNNVELSWNVDGFIMPKYSLAYNNLKTDIVINKRILPTMVKINNEQIIAGLNDFADVYVNANVNSNYLGHKINITASPSDVWSNNVVYIEGAENLVLKYSKDEEPSSFNGVYEIESGRDVYVLFKDSIAADEGVQTIRLKVKTVPDTFEGKNVTEQFSEIQYTLTRKVTADSIVVTDNLGFQLKEDELFIKKNAETRFQLRVNHEKGKLDYGTIRLTSNNSAVRFVSNSQEITLDHKDIVAEEKDSVTIFTIPIVCDNRNVDALITASVNNESVGVSTSFVAKAVETQSNTNISIKSDDVNYYKELTEVELSGTIDKTRIYLALIKGVTVDFETLLGDQSTGIKSVKLATIVESGFETDILSYEQGEIIGNKFELIGGSEGTQILSLITTYYSYNESAKTVTLVKTEPRIIEVAVCSPISLVGLKSSSDNIVYINEKFSEKVEITFSSLYHPTINLKFRGCTANNVSSIVLTLPQFDSAVDRDNTKISLAVDTEKYKLETANGKFYKIEDEKIVLYNTKLTEGIKLIDDDGKNILDGKIVIELTDKASANITPIFKPMFFDIGLTTSSKTIKNLTGDYKHADGVTIKGVTLNAINNPEINTTFLNVEQGGSIQVSFGAEAFYKGNENAHNYDDLGFFVYKLMEDEDGNIFEQGYEELTIVESLETKGTFIITADKEDYGGYFRIYVVAKDSYKKGSSGPISNQYAACNELYLRITDGTKENPYILYEDNFDYIRNDLKAYYVLGEDVELPSNFGSIEQFEGGLSGTYKTSDGKDSYISTQYSITLKVSSSNEHSGKTHYMTMGLFGVLAATAEISDLKIVADIDMTNISYSQSGGVVGIGALAGVNYGKISNVGVEIRSISELKTETEENGNKKGINNKVGELNLGVLVGVNYGEINVSSVITCSETTISTSVETLQNIGLVAGRNDGTISGNYKTKADLNEIVYSVIADLVVENKSTSDNTKYNVSAVAGTNNGTITGMVVGGRIELFNNTSDGVKDAKGYLSGIAGTNSGIVEANVALALDLTSKSTSLDVASLVGENTGLAIVSDGRVISVIMDFETFTSTGKIAGDGNVAGAVVKNSNLVEWIAVESFLSLQEDQAGNTSTYYMIEASSTGKTVAGLICDNAGTLKNSFVNANVDNKSNCYLTTNNNGTESDTYFIGLLGDGSKCNAPIGESSYAVVGGTLVEAYSGISPVNITESNLITKDTLWVIDNRTAENQAYNIVNGTAYPYLYKDKDMFMINRPTGLEVSIGAGYRIKPGAVVFVNSKIEDDGIIADNVYDKLIEETVIVNYYTVGSNNSDLNTHKISDLISKTIIPKDENVQGGIQYEIVQGGNFARIERNINGSEYSIVFLGVSHDEDENPTPIIVRCYSVFNNDIDTYVAFFTELGVSDIVLESNSIVERENQQTLSTYVGGNSMVVYVNSINDGNENYKTILDAKNKEDFLSLNFVATDVDGNPIAVDHSYSSAIKIGKFLTIDISDWINSGFKITVCEDAPIENKIEQINLTINLQIDLSKYSVTYLQGSQTLVTKDLKISVAESATEIEIKTGGDAGTYQTNANIGFVVDMVTSYVGDETIKTTATINEEDITKVNEFITFAVNNKDSVKIFLDVVEDEFDTVENLLKVNSCSLAELFDVYAYYTRTTNGYSYHVELSLRDEFNVRYITKPFTLNVRFFADSNSKVFDEVEITFIPTKVSTFRIQNYSAKTIDAYTQYTELISKSNTETSIISPGGNGGVLVIYMSPSYAFIDVDSLKIISDYVTVPTRNDADKRAFISFEQLIYNELTDTYEKLYPTNNVVFENADGTGRIIGSELTLATYKDEGENIHYDGVLYIHTMLEKFIGIKAPINVTFSANIGGEEKSINKELRTTYIPGTVLEYKGIKDENGEYFKNIAVKDTNGNTAGYLIQNNTYNNIIDVRVHGYQFASNPTVSFEWNLPANSPYHYSVQTASISSEKDYALSDEELFVLNEGVYVRATSYNKEQTYYIIKDKSLIYDDENNPISINNYVNYRILTNYEDAIKNADGSYTIQVGINLQQKLVSNFAVNISLSITNEDSVLTSRSLMNFYPTDYILRDISMENVNENGVLDVALSNSQLIEFAFGTNATNQDLSKDIYLQMLKDLGLGVEVDPIDENAENFKKLFQVGANTFNSDFSQFNVNLISFVEHEEIVNRLLNISAINTFTGQITFEIGYNYVKDSATGLYKIQFSDELDDADSSKYKLLYRWTLNIYPFSTDENAIPIYNETEFVEKLTNGANNHYILMNDIVLTNFTPITTAIASLDGNNKVITIKSFALNKNTTEYGLFGTLNTYVDPKTQETQKSILKNVIVDYAQLDSYALQFTNNEMTTITFGGLVANNIGGLIYNCDVMNKGNVEKTITILMDNDSTLTFGGLVGENSGVITNSRVGRRELTVVKYENGIVTPKTNNFAGLSFVIGNEQKISNGVKLNMFDSIVGGFVGTNSGTIASSYVSNTSITSHAEEDDGKLAGFAGRNAKNGIISYSYVRASDSALSSTSVFNEGAVIQSTTDSRVAGFVHTNEGEINNSFANIALKTTSKFLAGFVDNNYGRITESYAAATMNGVKGGTDVSERPFIGVNDLIKIQNYGNAVIDNCYYVMAKESQTYPGELAYGLMPTAMGESKNLIGFVFVSGSVKASQDFGVWTYYTKTGMKTVLPELVSANQIATSVRVPNAKSGIGEDGKYQYEYVPGYVLGKTKENPNIVRNAVEFNNVFRPNGTKSESFNGYVRFIDNFSFSKNQVPTAIATRTEFVLGDDELSTSIDGNGMKISDIYLDAEIAEISDSIGLFAEIKNAFVKNLNLSYVNPMSATSTSGIKAAGGLAGRIYNSAIINVDLTGDIVLQGNNFVGGLAGIITGKSMIYGISSNLNTKVKTSSNEIYVANSNDETKYSYAGGIAGVIDIQQFGKEDYNVAYIDAKVSSTNDDRKSNILAGFAGGVAGYAGANTNTIHAKLYYENSSKINGTYAAGGIYGLGFGSIQASQVAYMPVETKQYEIDQAIADYVLSTNGAKLDKTEIGNTALIESTGYSGGLVGVAVGARIGQSYAKVGFESGNVVGGLVGAMVGATEANDKYRGSIDYSYAVPVLSANSKGEWTIKTAGGLVGELWERTGTNNQDLLDACAVVAGLRKSQARANIQSTFSTIILDNVDQVEGKIDLLCPNFTTELAGTQSADFIDVYVGSGHNTKLTNEAGAVADTVSLKELLNKNNSSVQSSTFDTVFGTWDPCVYWSLDSTFFYPLLKEEDVSNYIEIDSADDLKMLELYPNLKYKVIKDIDMSTWVYENPNFIINADFSGSLVGEISEKNGTTSVPKIFNLHLTPTNSGNAGFFKSTRTALISDLEFVWDADSSTAAIDLNANLETVGVVSADDLTPNTENGDTEGSTFRNLTVKVGANGDGDLINRADKTIAGFGGIVGSATNSTIMNCSFYGSINANLYNDGGVVYYGGLVANGSSKSEDAPVGEINKTESMKISGGKVGNGKNTFTLTVGNCKKAYIGGAFGSLNGVSVSSVNVEKFAEEENITIQVLINNSSDDAQFNIGGIGGYISNSGGDYAITGCAIEAGIKVSSVATPTIVNANVVNVGGLLAEANGVGSIKANYINSDLDLNNLQCSTLTTSMGVAYAHGEGISLVENLFNGTISAEGYAKSNIYAGGAIGLLSGSATLSEILTNVAIIAGSSSTKTFVAGGLVGGAGINADVVDGATTTAIIDIDSCVSLGRIVPITSATDTNTIIGGFVGKATSVTTTSSYSLSSIITDGVGLGTISSENYKVNALYGTGGTTSDSVFYSSDVALCTDEFGTNLSANTMWNYANVWAKDSLNKDKFVHLENDTRLEKLPYIASLRIKMETCGLIDISSTLKYAEGSVLNPIVKTGGAFNDDKFNYYYTNANSDATVQYEGVLNGILIGSDNEAKMPNEFKSADDSDTRTGRGIVPVVNKHSAISNLHINVGSGISSSEITGIIAGINNGVMFNCSVSGHEVAVSGSDSFGAIVGANNGLVSYSFSTIEIIDTGSDLTVGGLVGQNEKGTITSCYFTGYINNASSVAGGVIGLVEDKGYKGYVYNSYMAGVITNVGANSFVGDAGSTETIFTNCYIDSRAGVEGEGFAVITKKLVLNNDLSTDPKKLLHGNWEVQVEFDESTNNITGFTGYNFGYPVIQLNKKVARTTTLLEPASSVAFHEWTGNGGLHTTNTEKPRALDTAYINIISGKSETNNGKSYYDNAIKISHLGLLTILDNVQDKNYVVIYDLDGTKIKDPDKKKIDWEAVKLSGLFMSNRYLEPHFKLDIEEKGYENVNNCPITISNLNNNGLFKELTNAFISDFKFAGKFELENSGVIGTDIKGTTTIQNLEFIKNNSANAEVFAKEDTCIGGLVGSINADVTINNIKTGNLTLYGAKATVGVIAGQMTGGSLTIDQKYVNADNKAETFVVTEDSGTYTTAIANPIYVNIGKSGNGVKVGGGLVGSTIGGATISGLPLGESSGILTTNNKIVTATSVSLYYNSTIYAENFGGVVGVVSGNTTLNDIAIINGFTVVNTNASTVGEQYYGLVASQVTGGKLEVKNFMVQGTGVAESSTQFNFNSVRTGTEYLYEKVAVGGVVGLMNGDVEFSVLTNPQNGEGTEEFNIFNPQINSPFNNLGGIAGVYQSGTPTISGIDSNNMFIVKGTSNVGGVFGLVEGSLTTAKFVELENQPTDWGNGEYFEYKQVEGKNTFVKVSFTTNEGVVSPAWDRGKYYEIQHTMQGGMHETLNKTISKVIVSSINGDTSGSTINSNIGGLFGLLKSNIPVVTNGSITNNNAIEFAKSVDEINFAKNIGGIAGSFVGQTEINVVFGDTTYEIVVTPNAEGLINKVNIGNMTSDINSIQFNVAESSENNKAKPINVGGIFGYVGTNVSIQNVLNSANISGYKNVGGYVGYFTGSGVAENAKFSIKINNNNKYNVYGVVNVGGVFGCLSNTKLTGESLLGNTSSGELTGMSVCGNTNIGALAGLIANAEVSNFTISAPRIKAIYEKSFDGGKSISVIPTGVGGLCGQVIDSTLSNNTILSPNITSTDEGLDGCSTISTVSNYMHKVEDATDSESVPVVVNFNTINTGFGGFVGTMDSSTATKTEITTNTLSNLTLNATLGVNVGGFYGYVNAEITGTGTRKLLITPTAQGMFKINGAYNIGSVAGNVNLSSDTSHLTAEFSSADVNTQSQVQVILQDQAIGMFVGGLFGVVTADKLELIINNSSNFKVTICTDSSYYMGGLVGRWNATGATPTFNGKVGTDVASGLVTSSAITSVLSAQEFGGMIGMLKVLGTDGKGNGVIPQNPNKPEDPYGVTVAGTHFYPFTVNTIENSNYTDGTGLFNAQEYTDAGEVYLASQAVYTNKDTFKIAKSQNANLEYTSTEITHAYLDNLGVSWSDTANSKTTDNYKLIQRFKEAYAAGKFNLTEGSSIQYQVTSIINNGYVTNHRIISEWKTIESEKDVDGLHTKDVTTSHGNYSSTTSYETKIVIISIPEGAENNKIFNPLRPESSMGWSLDYSLFKRFQRSIDVDSKESTFGNSIAVLYDAENIREMSVNAKGIMYIIYEKSDGDVLLYCKNAIASILKDQTGEYKVKNEEDNKYYYVDVDDTLGDESIWHNGIEYVNRFDLGGNESDWEARYKTLENNGTISDYYVDSETPLYGVKIYNENSHYNAATFVVEKYYDADGNKRADTNNLPSSVNLFNIDSYWKPRRDEAKRLGEKANKIHGKGKYDKAQGYYTEMRELLDASYSGEATGAMLSLYNYAVKSTNSGLLGYSYTRQLEYKKGKLQETFDGTIPDVNVNYAGYLYYSDVRPVDYYSSYWLEFDANGELKNPASYYSEIQYVPGEYEQKYAFYHGAYYIHPYAAEVNYTQSQDFFVRSNYTAAQITSDGYYYTYVGDINNNRNSDGSLGKLEQNQTFAYNNSLTADEIANKGYKEGYDYIQKTLYNSLEQDINYSGEKYWKLSRLESIPVDSEKYIDYIEVPKIESVDGEGNVIFAETPLYYNLSGYEIISESTNAKSVSEWEISGVRNADVDSIIIKVYPSSNECAIGSYLENAYFENIRNNSDLESSNVVKITQLVTYNYFEGGYRFDETDGKLYFTDNEDVDANDATSDEVPKNYKVSDANIFNKFGIPIGRLVKRHFLARREVASEYNYNKYPTNTEHNLYTRYFYGKDKDFEKANPYAASQPVKGYIVNQKGTNTLHYYKLAQTNYIDQTTGETKTKLVWVYDSQASQTSRNVEKKNNIEGMVRIAKQSYNKEGGPDVSGNNLPKIMDASFTMVEGKHKVSSEENTDPNGNKYYYVYQTWDVVTNGAGSPNKGYKTYLVESVVTNFGSIIIL